MKIKVLQDDGYERWVDPTQIQTGTERSVTIVSTSTSFLTSPALIGATSIKYIVGNNGANTEASFDLDPETGTITNFPISLNKHYTVIYTI